jgi:hypothetical protein
MHAGEAQKPVWTGFGSSALMRIQCYSEKENRRVLCQIVGMR